MFVKFEDPDPENNSGWFEDGLCRSGDTVKVYRATFADAMKLLTDLSNEYMALSSYL